MNLTAWLSGQGVLQAAVTAGVEALRQARAWHSRGTARRSQWLEQSGQGGESREWGMGDGGRSHRAVWVSGRTWAFAGRAVGRGGREPGSSRCYGPRPVLRDRKLLGKPSQARIGIGGARWELRPGLPGLQGQRAERLQRGRGQTEVQKGRLPWAAGWRP